MQLPASDATQGVLTAAILHKIPFLENTHSQTFCDESFFDAVINAVNQIKSTQTICYIPVINKRNKGKAFNSKFGGLPFLSEGEDWPICRSCNSPMSFGAQLNFEQFPELENIFNRKGLFQFFGCSKGCEANPNRPSGTSKDKSVLIRFIDDVTSPQKDVKPPISVSRNELIVKLEPRFDYPGYEITEELLGQPFDTFEIEVEDLNSKLDFEIFCPNYDDYPYYQEKTLGWYQGYGGSETHPDCPTCKKQMKIIIRLNGFPQDQYATDQVFTIFMCAEHHDFFIYKWFNVEW